MTASFFNEESESLVGYYILPLLGFGTKLFGSFFKSAKIDRDHTLVYVYLIRGCPEPYWKNRNFQVEYDSGKTVVAVFDVPKNHWKDVELFGKGLYSQMSKTAKSKIYLRSGLPHELRIGRYLVTDKRLLVLEKHKILREYLEMENGIEIGKNLELLELDNPDRVYKNDT